jgi:succinate dehydrogenase/fumarate reductase cytochrome b subunit
VASIGRLFIALLVIVGLVLIAVGIVYFVVKAGSLPSFFPGHLTGSTAHRSKHGLVAVVVGAVVLVLAVIFGAVGRRR